MANSLNERQKGILPSQPLPNPKNPFSINEAEDIISKQCNTVHILRSKKQVDNKVSNHPVSNNSVSNSPVIVPQASNDPYSSSSSQPSTFKSNEKNKTDEQTHKPIVPFSNRLATNKTNAQMEKIREIFNQVQINVPLLDVIQVPSYAKFLKDMCTKKKKTKVPKKILLASNISELLTGPIPVKYKDPGRPTISFIRGQTIINRVLLDLGASINLLSFSMYQQLGLGDLCPTRLLYN